MDRRLWVIQTRLMASAWTVGEGLTNKEIGLRLFLSARTVEKHVEQRLAKTGARTRRQLAATATRAHTPSLPA